MTEAEATATGGAEPFVHLHTHSEFSLLDGASRITELVKRAAEMGQPALAITDHGVLYGAVDLYTEAVSAGIKPIIGCEVYMAPRSHRDKEGRADRDPNHLVLLARDADGWTNLISLVTTAHLEGYYYKPRIDRALLAEHSRGLICLSGCVGGELPQAILSGDLDAAERVARQHLEIFGPDGYFLELQDHGMAEEAAVREGLLEIARRTGAPLVCTNDSHYIHPSDADAHDILLCLQTGSRRDDEKRLKFSGPHFYLTSGGQMRERFLAYGEAAANTLAVAERCDWKLELGRHHLPAYSPIPPGHDADSYLAELCDRGLRERYGDEPPGEARERLRMELDVIRRTGFAAYFLIVWDLIRAARCDGVVVGPGRGSAAGSLVAYTLRITNIDPLRYGLIFERFLNLERVEMPDIDIDFDDRRRDRVLHYVTAKYGQDRVAQIITFGTMAARAAIRDVGRVLDVPLPDVDRLAKLVPATIGITLDRALAESRDLHELYEGERWARDIIDVARRLEGISRNASTHAAGVVIGAEPLAGIVPLGRSTSANEGVVTQFDMKGVSKIGLLKMDFLGLANLTVIEEAVENIERVRGERLDIDAIPLDDAKTYELLGRADTHGVFQLEATLGKRILIDMQPHSLEDLAAANALIRPGPLEGKVVDLYIRRRRGEEPITYLLPEMEPILAETFGTMIYQDQVMKIASAVAGFSLGEADILRAAMGKKDKLKMAQQREKFLAGAVARGVEERTAAELFDLIAFFAGYGFNAAHSYAYALIGYQTAYLKANYPLEYMTALLNSRAGDFDKLKLTILDAHARGLTVQLPDINRSDAGFAVGDAAKGEILYGLGHIKNAGERVMEQLVEERRRGGPFTSLYDLCLRVGVRELNRRVLEALIKSGACDGLGERAGLLAALDRAMDRATQVRRERELGQASLFGDDAAEESAPSPFDEFGTVTEVPPLAADERLRWEREHLGMYLSDHPLRRVADRLAGRVDTSIGDLGSHLDGVYVQIGGTIRDLRAFIPRRSTSGQRMAFMTLEDLSGACEVVVFARTFEECANLLRPDQVVVVRGRVQAGRNGRVAAPGGTPAATEEEEQHSESEQISVIAEALYDLEDVRLAAWRSHSRVRLRLHHGQQPGLPALRSLLERHPGETPVVLQLIGERAVDEVALGEEWRVEPGPALERAIESLLGEGSYRLEVERQRAPDREGARRR
ncbi:MAG TPA: DNA polymerase III subunit alpha [Candidatus Binatia bacterium]|nr:DNA polymerase III subunit alpha [Candidatus Binatia bacterium]